MRKKWLSQPQEPMVRKIRPRRGGIEVCFADYLTRVLLTRLLGVWGVTLGIAFTAGGYDRISSPTFGTIASVPFAPASWGIPLAIIGAVVLVMAFQPLTMDRRGHIERLILQIGLFCMAVWNASFAIAFSLEIFAVPIAAVSGPFTYGLGAAVALVLMVSHRVWDAHVER